MMPAETPMIGITDTAAEPRKRPRMKSRRRTGVEKIICQVS